jgi:hypothetical protein
MLRARGISLGPHGLYIFQPPSLSLPLSFALPRTLPLSLPLSVFFVTPSPTRSPLFPRSFCFWSCVPMQGDWLPDPHEVFRANDPAACVLASVVCILPSLPPSSPLSTSPPHSSFRLRLARLCARPCVFASVFARTARMVPIPPDPSSLPPQIKDSR